MDIADEALKLLFCVAQAKRTEIMDKHAKLMEAREFGYENTEQRLTADLFRIVRRYKGV
jgi:hypothetical protein